jgi:hypothetical protein
MALIKTVRSEKPALPLVEWWAIFVSFAVAASMLGWTLYVTS